MAARSNALWAIAGMMFAFLLLATGGGIYYFYQQQLNNRAQAAQFKQAQDAQSKLQASVDRQQQIQACQAQVRKSYDAMVVPGTVNPLAGEEEAKIEACATQN